MTDNKGLRFAPIVRVSSEGQDKRGESLNVQKKTIESNVKALGGMLIPNPWRYSGQEHSTPSFERQKRDELLGDSDKDIFDAVILSDYDRWSRDNEKSKQAIRILRANGIRFFVGTSEHDLFNPEDRFKVGVSVEIAEYVALKQIRKALQSRIERAGKGWCVSKMKPVGRTWDNKEKKWGLDSAVQQKYRNIAQDFLSGETLHGLSRKYGHSCATLRENLKNAMGDSYVQTIDGTKYGLGTHKIETKIPRLLEEETIRAIRERLKANKTVYHGQRVHHYLLGRILICGHCNHALYGMTNRNRYRYYRHPSDCDCDYKAINADLIEKIITEKIFELIGDAPKMEAAVMAAIPRAEEREKIQSQIKNLKKDLTQINQKKNRLMDAIEAGAITVEEVDLRMKNHRAKSEYLTSEIQKMEDRIKDIPDTEISVQRAKLALVQLQRSMAGWKHFSKMSWGDKRKMLQMAFGHPDPARPERLGVYLWWDNKDPDHPWRYEIRGSIYGGELFDIDLFSEPKKKVKQNTTLTTGTAHR